MADVTLVNLNMLYVRYVDRVERELHLPLGPLYLARSLENAGYEVDFRDYQLCESWDLFSSDVIAGFLADSSEILFVSCMANLMPFALLALEAFKAEHPETFVALGGVGPAAIEKQVLERCPFIDAIGIGEGERTAVELVRAVKAGRNLAGVRGIAFRHDGRVVVGPPQPRIEKVDEIAFPAYHLVDLSRYSGINLMSSRGCPFPCTFCSVAPIWGRRPQLRSPENIAEEMQLLHDLRGPKLFLFQDEYFVSSPKRVRALCDAIGALDFEPRWKAFGRIDLTDVPTMEAMAKSGCVEIRYGVESGSPEVLARTRKGFSPEEAHETLSTAVGIFPGVDAFYMWGFPFESVADFNRTLLHMVASRAMGTRILPSLLSLLPQTALYDELRRELRLEFFPELFPEYMLTGCEICDDGRMQIAAEHAPIYDFVQQNADIFPGFFHADVEHNVLPKYRLLQKFGFYALAGRTELLGAEIESCGAHSPH